MFKWHSFFLQYFCSLNNGLHTFVVFIVCVRIGENGMNNFTLCCPVTFMTLSIFRRIFVFLILHIHNFILNWIQLILAWIHYIMNESMSFNCFPDLKFIKIYKSNKIQFPLYNTLYFHFYHVKYDMKSFYFSFATAFCDSWLLKNNQIPV